jgi:hypothetical protein
MDPAFKGDGQADRKHDYNRKHEETTHLEKPY